MESIRSQVAHLHLDIMNFLTSSIRSDFVLFVALMGCVLKSRGDEAEFLFD